MTVCRNHVIIIASFQKTLGKEYFLIPPAKPAALQKAPAQREYHWGLEAVIFIALFFVSQLLISVPVAAAEGIARVMEQTAPSASGAQPDWLLPVQLYSTALMTLTVLLFCHLIQNRTPASLGLARQHAGREYLMGALIGMLLFCTAIAACVATGTVELKTARFSIGGWLLFLGGFLVQGMSEEVLCRGYLMLSVARRYPLWLAILLNSILFSLLHVWNRGICFLALLNIALFGVLASLYTLRRGSLWGTCALHSLWNFVQGNLFGVRVSGTESGPSPLCAIPRSGAELWHGGAFGLEGGLTVTLVLFAAILILLFLVPNADVSCDSSWQALKPSKKP